MSYEAKILICDDDPMMVEMLDFRFVAKGYDVLVAGNGMEGLQVFRLLKPDLVVLDAMMPGMDGLQLLYELRSTRDYPKIPVIMLTARSGQQHIVEALECGADDYLSKPFMPDELLARVRRLLAKSLH